MDWTEICIHTSEEAVEALSHFLHEAGLEGVVIEDREVLSREWDMQYGKVIALDQADYPEHGVRIKAYLPTTENTANIMEKIHVFMTQLPSFGLDPGVKKITTQRIKRQDWAESWKSHFRLKQITERITIKPEWETYHARHSDEIVITLDPGLAFGTGQHVTTSQCLHYLDTYLQPGDHVIDVGCGSGILSIASSKLGAAQTWAIDLDPEAVKETEKHCRLNQIEKGIHLLQSDGLKQISHRAHLVVGNLLAEILIPLIADVPRVLYPGGMFIAAGILEEKADQVIQVCRQTGLQVCEVNQQDDWVAIVLKKW